MRETRSKISLLLTLAVSMLTTAPRAGPTGGGASGTPPSLSEAVAVTLHAYRTYAGGATEDASSNGADLHLGEEGSIYLTLGRFDEDGKAVETLCNGIGSGVPEPEAVERAVTIWRASFTPLGATMDSLTLRAAWSRETADRPGVHVRRAGGVQTFSLQEGQSRTLDFLWPSASDAGGFCGDSLRIDVRADVKEDPALADTPLLYDLWLLEQGPGEAPIHHHLQATGKQGEEVSVTFPALRWPLEGLTSQGDRAVQVFAELSAGIKGRLRPDGSIDLQFSAGRWLGLGGEKRIGGIGDGGKKTLRLQPGDVLDLSLPRPRASHRIALDRAPNVRPKGKGVEVTDNFVTVEFEPFFSGHTVSFRLTARPGPR